MKFKYKINGVIFPSDFIVFLKNNKILELYINNGKRTPYFKTKMPKERLIANAFLWSTAEGGFSFWSDINFKWIKILENET